MFFHKQMGRPFRVHFSGIGGIAMVAGARLAIETGLEVRGSDNPLYPPASEMVEALGVPVATSYDDSNLDWGPDLVVIGNVLSRGNPEVEAILERKIHYVSLPEWIKDTVLRNRRPVVICGTHGKTTTTSLTAFLLDRLGHKPGYFIGGQPLDFEHSARLGNEKAPFVIEGDEYDTAFFDKRAKFFHYLPEIAIVTSLEFDHGDIYKDIADIELSFQRMLRQIPGSGNLIVCADSPRALALREHAFCNLTSYGFSEDADWRITDRQTNIDGYSRITVSNQGAEWGKFNVPLAGRHNLQNVLAAVVVAATLGAAPDEIGEAIYHFRGVKRRMEVFLEKNGITFVDDFAHHPTAIRGAIEASRDRWAGRRLIVLFEPRSNTTVTKRFQQDLEVAFTGADVLLIAPIYRPERIPVDERLDREGLAQRLSNQGVQAKAVHNIEDMVQYLKVSAMRDDVILFLSNGAFGGIYDRVRIEFS